VTTLVAVGVLVVLFVLFALLGPAERSKPCAGRGPGERPCRGCWLNESREGSCPGSWQGCPGSDEGPPQGSEARGRASDLDP